MKKINFLGFIFFLAVQSFAFSADTTPPEFQRDAAKVNCNDELKICTYISQNITARELIAKLNSNLFPGSILSPSEGYITLDGIKKINFYINNPELRQKLIATIPLMDALEDFDPSDLVMLTTDIYSLTDSGLTNIQASLVNANSTNSELAQWAISSALGGPTGMALKIGTNLLSSLLGSSKVKEESSKVTTVNQLIPNQSGINFSNTSKVYISPPTSGVVKEEQAGLSVSGTVSISARDSDIVLIKDYNLTYGVVDTVTTGERVNILSVNNPQLYLVKGTSSIVVSSITEETSNKTQYSAVSYDKTKGKSLTKLMIVTRAEAVNFNDFISDLKKMRQLDLHQQFTPEEVKKLPLTEVKTQDLLSHIKPLAYFTTSGDRILGIKLDINDAREGNIGKNIEIKITSGLFSKNLKQKVILPVENLMLSGLKLDPLDAKSLKKTELDIQVSMKVYNQPGTEVVTTLHYNPETNRFFE